MKMIADGVNSRLNTAKAKIYKPEDVVLEIV